MKQVYILIFLFLVFSCNNLSQELNEDHRQIHEQMDKATIEILEFEKLVIDFYNQSTSDPHKVIEQSQKLIVKIQKESDPYNLKWNKLGYLYDLRAEVFYLMGQYDNSINELKRDHENNKNEIGSNSLGPENCIHSACNYVKLNDYFKAKRLIDSAGKAYYISDFVLANYYEVVDDKDQALKAYSKIKDNKEIDHYEFYQLAVKRIEELNKPNPQLLDELYYPPSRPDYEICKTDNERRTKIFELIHNLQEVKSCNACDVVSIYKEPDETNSSNYWIRVGTNDKSTFISKFNFFVDTLTYEIKYLDTLTNKEVRLEEWRRRQIKD